MNSAEDNVLEVLRDEVTLQSILDAISLGIMVVDQNRRLSFMNRAAQVLTGMDPYMYKGIPCRYILRGTWCVQKCLALEAQENSFTVVREGDFINRERQKIQARLSCTPLKNSLGEIVGFLEVIENLKTSSNSLSSDIPLRFSRFVARSSQMERIFQIAQGIAQTDSSVLITGETGTGKDLLAEVIHEASPRSKGPFVKVNCGALPETLLESELFGHEKGAFTGATHAKPGRFRLAHTGTLFLTEIGDLPLSLQVKLLSFLDDRVIYPLGSTKGVPVDVRIIAATHRNLQEMVREGRFREDLFYRLNVVRIHIPPLRERPDDIKLLLYHFLKHFSAEFRKPIENFSPETLSFLLSYSYPGNVRELRNIIEYAVNICTEQQIKISNLPSYLTEASVTAFEPTPSQDKKPVPVEPLRNETFPPKEPHPLSVPDSQDDTFSPNPSIPLEIPPNPRWDDVERAMIIDALIKAKGKRSKAAQILGWGRSTLWRKMRQYNIVSS
ncbi:MAG: sigma 54-interacting transcriptional regulator [Thermodesulforhabdaceae bacterium]